MERINLLGLLPDEIGEKIAVLGLPSYRASQIFRWVQKLRVTQFEEMKNLPPPLRKELEEQFTLDRPVEVSRSAPPRGKSQKVLYRMSDQIRVETVLIGEEGKETLCLSSQAGCLYKCSFCATAIGGLRRSLRADEMIGQVLAPNSAPKRIVYMGMGEPLANYKNVVQSLRILTHPEGLDMTPRRITVSTAGLAPMIDRLADEELGVRLAISLFSADNAKRSRFMPINQKYPLTSLLKSAARFSRISSHPVTFEYPMIAGVNDGVEDARLLTRKLNSISCKINIIPFNPVSEFPFTPPSEEVLNRFLGILSGRLTVTVRRSAGRQIDAACGQLRLREEGKETS